MDTAICKHSLDFSIALLSFCTCTGSNMVVLQYQHLWGLSTGGSVYLGTQHAQTSMYSCQHREPLSKIFGSFNILGLPIPKQTEMENHTILCQYRYCTVHLCSGKINKYLSGSNRERSIGEGMAVPELRTRFFKNW